MRIAQLLLLFVFLGPFVADAQERPLDLPENLRVETARAIRLHGFAYPEVKQSTWVEYNIRGDNVGVVCGPIGGPPNPMLKFRMTTTGDTGRVEPWQAK